MIYFTAEALWRTKSKAPVTHPASGIVAAFDFDGAMTTRDTLRMFLVYAFGRRRVARELARMAPELAQYLIGARSRHQIKAQLVRTLFADRVQWHREQGHRTVMVSASLYVYLPRLAIRLGFDNLLCTRLSHSKGVYDGEIVGQNCRDEEKVRQPSELIGGCYAHRIYAYGDSAGDRELLATADHSFYKPFRGRALAPDAL